MTRSGWGELGVEPRVTDFGCVENRYWLITDTVSFFVTHFGCVENRYWLVTPIFENLGNAPEPVMERRILVGAAEPVLDMQQYRFWHITAIGQKITSNGSLPLWVVTHT